MSLPGSNPTPLAAGGTTSLPSAANTIVQYTGTYLSTVTSLSATAADYHLSREISAPSTQAAFSLSSHSQGLIPASTPPVVTNDTKVPSQYQHGYAMNHSISYRSINQGQQMMYNSVRNPSQRPMQQVRGSYFVCPPASYIMPNTALISNSSANLQTTYPISSSTTTDQSPNLYFALPNNSLPPFPHNLSVPRPTWASSGRAASQNIVSLQPSNMIQNSPVYANINHVPSIQQQQQPPQSQQQQQQQQQQSQPLQLTQTQQQTQIAIQLKKRSHAIPIIDPDTGDEVRINDEKKSNDFKEADCRDTFESELKDFSCDIRPTSDASTDFHTPKSSVSLVDNKEQSQTDKKNSGLLNVSYVTSPKECKFIPPSINNTLTQQVDDSVDSANMLIKSTAVSNTAQLRRIEKSTRENEKTLANSVSAPQQQALNSNFLKAGEPKGASSTSSLEVGASMNTNGDESLKTDLNEAVSEADVLVSLKNASTVSLVKYSAASNDSLNNASIVTSNLAGLDTESDKITKKVAVKHDPQSKANAVFSKDVLLKKSSEKQIGNTVSSQVLTELKHITIPVSGPLAAQPKSENKSHFDLTLQSVVLPANAAVPSSKFLMAERLSLILTQSLPFNEPFPAKSISVTNQSICNFEKKDEKSNPSAKSKIRGKEHNSENTSCNDHLSSIKNKSQSLTKHVSSDSTKSINSSTTDSITPTKTSELPQDPTEVIGKPKKKKGSNKKEVNEKIPEKEGADVDVMTSVENPNPAGKIMNEKSSLLNTNNNNRSKINSSQKSDISSVSQVDAKEKISNFHNILVVSMGTGASMIEDNKRKVTVKSERKKYTIEFMMKLRDAPQCKLAVYLRYTQLSYPISSGGSGSMSHNGFSSSNFLPTFSLQSSSSLPSRKSQQGSVRRDKPNQLHISLSLRDEAPLRRIKDAWKPTIFANDEKSLSGEEKKTELLYKNARGLLNKLTPEKFSILIEKFKTLPMDTSERLAGVIDLIFEKAIDEPGFCKWYAEMCNIMQSLTVVVDNASTKSFRTILLTKCQNQFENTKIDEEDAEKKLVEIQSCSDPEKKKELQFLFEEKERKIRLKSVGNCRFIGELFKLKMLTTQIVLRCIRHLLTQLDEEPLECLCKLLTTIGKDLDNKSSKDLDGVCKRLQEIAENKNNKVSSRIRFMILDVIELRKNKWVPRRETDNPKTMDQINMEIEKKEQDQKVANLSSRRSYDDYGGRNRDLRKSRNNNQSSEDRKGVNIKSSYNKPYKYDSQKLNSLLQQPSTGSDTPLGPGSGFSFWRGGCTTTQTDKKGSLIITHSTTSSFVADSRNSSGGKLTPSGSLERPKSSQVLQDDDANKITRRGSSRSIYPQSRESSVQRSSLFRCATQSTPTSASEPSIDDETVKKYAKTILIEYESNKNSEDSVAAFTERFTSDQIRSAAIDKFINLVLEENYLTQACGELVAVLLKRNIITWTHVSEALTSFVKLEDELLCYYPKLWDYISQVFSVIIKSSTCYNEFEKSLSEKVLGTASSSFLIKLNTKIGTSKPSEESQLFQYFLKNLDNDNFNNIVKWIDQNVKETRHSTTIVHALTKAICEILLKKYKNLNGMEGDPRITELFEKKFFNFFKKYIENEEDQEILCLRTILDFAKAKQFPNGLLLTVLNALYDSKSLSVDSFRQWRESIKDRESVAMVTLKTFFDSINPPSYNVNG